MIILKFNESEKVATDKFVRIYLNDFMYDVPIQTIESMNSFSKYSKSDRQNAIFYGAEEYLITKGRIDYVDSDVYEPEYYVELVDGLGNLIEDEEEFDKYNDDIKKYNV